MPATEAGHHPNRVFIDQGGNLHLNGSTLYVEGGTFAAPTANVITPATGVSAAEYGDAFNHTTVLTITDVPIAINDTSVGGGTHIFTFPQGRVTIIGASGSVTPTTTTTLTSTLNASSKLSFGVGSVQTTTQASGTLATTQQDMVAAGSCTSSATINVAGTAGTSGLVTPVGFNGSSSAQKAYLNVGVPTAGDIDADATITMSGSVTLTWNFHGAV